MSRVWVCRVVYASGSEELEILDSEPAPSFLEGLDSAQSAGRILGYVIRTGYVNGGDSSEEVNTLPRN